MIIGTAVYLEKLKEDLEFYKKNYNVLELQDFIMPDNLEKNRECLIGQYKKLLADYSGILTIHGPYIDLYSTSFDPMIKRVSIIRYRQALMIASELNAKAIVIHSDYDNNKIYDGYDDYLYEENIKLWQDLMKEFESQKIMAVMENVLNKNPYVIKKIVEKINSPYLKACLDIGHANVHGEIDLLEWVKIYGDDLAYVHLHDNHGEKDQHLPIGEGKINFLEFFKEIKKLESNIYIISEIFGGIEEQKRNLKNIKKLI